KLRIQCLLQSKPSLRTESVILLPTNTRTWEMERSYMSRYEQLGILIKSQYRKEQHQKLEKYRVAFESRYGAQMPTLNYLDLRNEAVCLQRLEQRRHKLQSSYDIALSVWNTVIDDYRPYLMALTRMQHDMYLANYHNHHIADLQSSYTSLETSARPFLQRVLQVRATLEEYRKLQSAIHFIRDKRAWIERESLNLKILISPLLSRFHWEDDAGGSRSMNKHIRWWQLTRINRKDLMSSLIFGIRIALIVGGLGVIIAFSLGVLIGLISGYFGGAIDMVLSRFTEIWETMPTLFILMLVVGITQQKSLILNTVLLGCFGWTGFSRYIRIETLKQRNQPYVLAASNLGYSHYYIMVHQILPNAIVPVIALLPFSVMSMISCEAGLTFVGLGEESSVSWGSLMREGVTAFPSESAVLWPAAIMLTTLLVAIALIGDGVRDALDPKL
ncbi:binding--dependent transport system inner membrane component family protein, partial [Chlamydia ibidis]